MTTRKNNPIYIMLVAYRQGKMTEDFIHFDKIVELESLYSTLRWIDERIHVLETELDNEGFFVDNSSAVSELHREIGATIEAIKEKRESLSKLLVS